MRRSTGCASPGGFILGKRVDQEAALYSAVAHLIGKCPAVNGLATSAIASC
jgi:hypothetical protein